MNEAVFISDLHLHPEMPAISERFRAFIQWAAGQTKSLYILGDFFHVWPGDDAINAWSGEIADQLAWLATQGVRLFFIPGNRDFLLGKRFLARANMQRLADATTIQLGQERVLLVHGDHYCTDDKSHQRLRRLTRNQLFSALFLRIPYRFRERCTNQVRAYSQASMKSAKKLLIVPAAMSKQLFQLKVRTVIHGHIHQPGMTQHTDKWGNYRQYVLSDWDESPTFLCYNEANKLYFMTLCDGK